MHLKELDFIKHDKLEIYSSMTCTKISLDIINDKAYCSGPKGVVIVDISEPNQLKLISSVYDTKTTRSHSTILIYNEIYAFIMGGSYFSVLDISNNSVKN